MDAWCDLHLPLLNAGSRVSRVVRLQRRKGLPRMPLGNVGVRLESWTYRNSYYGAAPAGYRVYVAFHHGGDAYLPHIPLGVWRLDTFDRALRRIGHLYG